MQPAFRGGRPERMHLAHGNELGFHLACGGTNKSRPADGYMMVMGAFGTGRFFVWIVVFFSIFTYTMKLQ